MNLERELQGVCIACGSKSAKVVGRTRAVGAGETDLALCEECGTLYRWPRPSKKDVDAFYENSNFFNPPPGKYGLWIREKTARSRVSTYAQMIKSEGLALEKCLFLDVGSGIGLHCKNAIRMGFLNPTGFEPREWACEYGKKTFGVNLERTLGDRDKLVEAIAANGSAESVLVFCSHVLEHIVELEEFLKMFDDLPAGGKRVFVAILVPHVSSETQIENGEVTSHLWEQHMQSFSSEGLSRLVKSIGWRELLLEKHVNVVRRLGVRVLNGGQRFNRIGRAICRRASRGLNYLGTIVGTKCCTDHPVEIRVGVEATQKGGVRSENP